MIDITLIQTIQTLSPFGLAIVLYFWFDKKLELQKKDYEEKLRATNEYYRQEISKLSDKYDDVSRELGRREGVSTVIDKIDSKLDILINK